MSNAPYLLPKARSGYRLGNGELVDSMIHDGLWDPYDHVHMGNCGDLVAEKFGFSREEQDAFAAESYRRAQAAQKEGRFKEEIVPVAVPQRRGEPILVDEDEEPARIQLDKLSQLPPAFTKTGTVTAANASTLNDGAAALLVTSRAVAEARDYNVLARIVADASAAQEPKWFTTAPVEALRRLYEKTGTRARDWDLYEINEAFSGRHDGGDPRARSRCAACQRQRRRRRARSSDRLLGCAPPRDAALRPARPQAAPRDRHALHRRRRGSGARRGARLAAGHSPGAGAEGAVRGSDSPRRRKRPFRAKRCGGATLRRPRARAFGADRRPRRRPVWPWESLPALRRARNRQDAARQGDRRSRRAPGDAGALGPRVGRRRAAGVLAVGSDPPVVRAGRGSGDPGAGARRRCGLCQPTGTRARSGFPRRAGCGAPRSRQLPLLSVRLDHRVSAQRSRAPPVSHRPR